MEDPSYHVENTTHVHTMDGDTVENRAPVLIHGLWTMTAISFLFMALRLFCKVRYGKPIAWDDHILIFSWICLLIYAVFTIISCSYGIGHHIYDIEPATLSRGIELLYVGEFFAIIAVAISKTSFIVTLLRLTTERWQKITLWAIIITLNIVMWTCAIFQYVQCWPVEKLWNPLVEGSCWAPEVQIYYAIFAGAYSAAMDFLLALFPWLIIRNLQIKAREKFGVVFAMSLGILAGITACVKTSYLVDIMRWTDFTFSAVNLLIWAAAETAVTIAAASIPIFRLMLKEVVSKSRTKYGASTTLTNNNTSGQGYTFDEMGSYRNMPGTSGGNSNVDGATAAQLPVAGRTRVRVAAKGADGASDKSILDETRYEGSGILQTDEILVETTVVEEKGEKLSV